MVESHPGIAYLANDVATASIHAAYDAVFAKPQFTEAQTSLRG